MTKITISPDPPEFGLLCVGFVYSLKIVISNHGVDIERFRVKIVSAEDNSNILNYNSQPMNLAPGVSGYCVVELKALNIGKFSYNCTVTSETTKNIEYRTICGTIAPSKLFKKVSKLLAFQNKPTYSVGVKCHNQILNPEVASSYFSSVPTLYSENLIDDDELDDLVDLPILPCMYWDPYSKKLCVDEDLCKVEINPDWRVDESIRASKIKWEDRLNDLENDGMVTARALDKIVSDRYNVPANLVHIGSSKSFFDKLK